MSNDTLDWFYQSVLMRGGGVWGITRRYVDLFYFRNYSLQSETRRDTVSSLLA